MPQRPVTVLFASLLLLLAWLPAANAQTHQLVVDSTTLGWTGRAATGAYALSGTLDAKAGWLDVTQNTIRKAQLVIDMNSIRSDIDQLTQHLKADDFFHTERYPTATFNLTKPATLAADTVELTGTITVRGIDAPMVIRAVKLPSTTLQQIRLQGVALIDRTVHGITFGTEPGERNGVAKQFELRFELVFNSL